MDSPNLFLPCILICLVAVVYAYPNGAPCEAVDRLQPGSPHGDPQTGPAPYGLRVLLGNQRVRDGVIQPFYHYTIEIYGICNKWTPIKGFLLKAYNATTGSVIGRFTKDEQSYWQATHYACRDQQLGAVTHFLAYERDQPVGFKWVLEDSPRNVEYKDVRFEATVMVNLKTYWKNIVWPEPKETVCRCADQDDFKKACLGYFRAGYCFEASIRDDLCPYTCNNCSGNVTLSDTTTAPTTVTHNVTLSTLVLGGGLSSQFASSISSTSGTSTTSTPTTSFTTASTSISTSPSTSTSTSASTSTSTSSTSTTSTSTSSSTTTASTSSPSTTSSQSSQSISTSGRSSDTNPSSTQSSANIEIKATKPIIIRFAEDQE